MHPLQIAIIWLLCVTLGGVASVAIWLWIHRHEPQHAAPRPSSPLRSISAYVAAMQRALPGGTPWNDDGRLRDLDCPECGIPWAQPSPDCPRLVYGLHKRETEGTAGDAIAECVITNQRLIDFYRQREERLTQQLLDAGAARWH